MPKIARVREICEMFVYKHSQIIEYLKNWTIKTSDNPETIVLYKAHL